jgi:hypothetical protein
MRVTRAQAPADLISYIDSCGTQRTGSSLVVGGFLISFLASAPSRRTSHYRRRGVGGTRPGWLDRWTVTTRIFKCFFARASHLLQLQNSSI